MEVKVHEAKEHFARLLRRVEAGEEITIMRGNTPVARLIPIAPSRLAAQGMDQGRVWIAEDFDAPDASFEVLFEGTQKRTTRSKR
jgi:prevent-host-death family protein